MTCSTDRLPRAARYAFLLALTALLLLAAWQWRNGPPISANLLELLPESQQDDLQQQAEQRMQEPLNRNLILLIQHAQPERATQLAQQMGEQLKHSGLYQSVRWNLQQDLEAVRQQLREQRVALLPQAARQQLQQQPEAYLQARLERLYDPFAATLLSTEEDWLGLAEQIQNSLNLGSAVQPDASGHLIVEHQGQTWALIQAQTQGNAFDDQLPLRVAEQVANIRQQVTQAGGQLLATSGLLYAAHSQQQARQESSLMGGLSLLASLSLLWLLFRTPKVLLAMLPVLVGVLAGAVACVALFGQIHVMTLVLGASLIGVTLDFPLHYLSKSWALQPWRPLHALRLTRHGMTLALLTNLIGYLALAFTPFPALTQVAIFSAAGLIGAYACTLWLLPALLPHLAPKPAPLGWAGRLLKLRTALLKRCPSSWLVSAVVLFCLFGSLQVSLNDDLRQWVNSDPQLTEQAKQIGELVDYQPTSQFFLLRASDQNQLLQHLQQLGQALDQQIVQGQLQGYQSLSQLLSSTEQQQALKSALAQLPAHAEALYSLGVTPAQLSQEINQLQQQPLYDIDSLLAGPLGEAWRPLWLGAQGDQVAAIVALRGIQDVSALAAVAQSTPQAQFVDRLGQLNQVFSATQIKAAELKLLACVLIVLLLKYSFGWRGALRCLAVPLLAAWASLACLGWLGQPLTLFGVFGLLLVTAIGVDYAILMREHIGGAAVSLLGTGLAAVTTWLSFGLLALSSTPAVSNFGLAVSLGLFFAFIFAPWAASRTEPSA